VEPLVIGENVDLGIEVGSTSRRGADRLVKPSGHIVYPGDLIVIDAGPPPPST
jgi:hypothetical protein